MPPARFAPRMLALSGKAAADVATANWLGFDLDHAVARYRLPALTRLVHECLASALVELGHFPAAAFTTGWGPRCMQRGLILDFHTGCSLVLAEDGSIGQAWRGQRRLAVDEIAALYSARDCSDGAAPSSARGIVWPGMRILRSQGRHDSFFVLLAHFEVPAVCAFQQLVEWVDRQSESHSHPAADSSGTGSSNGGPSHESLLAAETVEGDALRAALAAGQGYDEIALPPRYARVRAGLFAAFNHIFDNVEGMASGRGGFFSALRADPAAYVFPRPRLAAALLRWRRDLRRRSLLVTNSHVAFAQLILEASLGPHWRDCFDLVVFNGSKPAFFVKHSTPFYSINAATQTEGPVLEKLRLPLLPPATADAAPQPAVLAMQGNAYSVQAMADVLVTLEYVRDGLIREAGGAADVGPIPTAVTAVFSPSGELQQLEVETGVVEGHVTVATAATGHPDSEPATVAAGAAYDGVAVAPQLRDVTGDFPAATPGLPARRPPLLRHASAFAAEPVSATAPSRARFVYIGDHIHGDVVAAATARLPRRAAPLAWRIGACASRSASEKIFESESRSAAGATSDASASAGAGDVAAAPAGSLRSASAGALGGEAASHAGWQAVAVLEELEASLPGEHALGRIGAAGGAPIELPRVHGASGYAFARNFSSATDTDRDADAASTASAASAPGSAAMAQVHVSGSGSATTLTSAERGANSDSGMDSRGTLAAIDGLKLLPPSIWGSFFVACGTGGASQAAGGLGSGATSTCSCCSASCGCNETTAALAASGGEGSAASGIPPLHQPGCRCRGYFCSLLQAHAAACWSDVEAALDVLLSETDPA